MSSAQCKVHESPALHLLHTQGDAALSCSLSSPAKCLSQQPYSAKAIQHSLNELRGIFSRTEKENSGKAPISIFKKEI